MGMFMLDFASAVAIALVCGAAGALARHGQGGAWRRWQAMVLYVVCVLPTIYSYGWGGNDFMAYVASLNYLTGAFLIGLFYADMICKQEFGNLWLGLARNCGPLLMLFFCTGVWEVLFGMPIIFVAMKWAKEPHDYDSHKVFEYILGGVTGFAWGYAPLARAW